MCLSPPPFADSVVVVVTAVPHSLHYMCAVCDIINIIIIIIIIIMDRDELPAEIQAAAAKLGYKQKYWDKDKTPKECDQDWDDLTPDQQE